MTATILKPGTGAELKRIFGMLANSIGESLGSLVGRELVVRPGEPEAHDVASFTGALPRSVVVARGALEKALAGKSMLVVLELPDAIAMAGLLMMTPEDVVNQRRSSGELGQEDATAFGELGNVMFAGFANVLREANAEFEVRYQDHVAVQAEAGEHEVFGTEPLVALPFRLKLGEYPESRGFVLVDQATATAFNKEPLALVAATGAAGGGTAAPAARPTRTEEETFESIPAAPIRGTLAAFVMQPEVFRTLRLACRRVGLELRRHGRGEIPNPAAHKNEVVLMDVPPGEDRRFDWCKRIKDLSNSTRVVLLIHHPSRHRVMQAFVAKADAILGFPCEEAQLSQKLAAVLDSQPAEPPLP